MIIFFKKKNFAPAYTINIFKLLFCLLIRSFISAFCPLRGAFEDGGLALIYTVHWRTFFEPYKFAADYLKLRPRYFSNT